MAHKYGTVLSIDLLMFTRIIVLHLITIKSETWYISHSLWLGHEICSGKWTYIWNFLILVIKISDIGKSTYWYWIHLDMGRLSYFPISVNHLPISNIRITNIDNSIYLFWLIQNDFLIFENHFDLAISENHPFCWYWKFELPISVIHFLILENQPIYQYRKFNLPISVI